MNLFKRFLACSLAVLMMSGMLMTGVAAKSFNDVASEDRYSESINVLSDIGVVVGTSENEFSPSENVTREQMALFLFRIMLGKQDAGTTNSSQFLDLYDVTYNGAISWASASGYIIGTSETTFNPVGGITFQDALTMLVRALGYGNKQMDAGYPWTYIDQAIKLGLDNHMEDVDYNKTLTRAEVASVLYNALTADYLIPKNVIGGTTFYETTTIIEYVFGYQMETAVLAATNNYALPGFETVVKNNFVTLTYKDQSNNYTNMTVNFEDLGLEGKEEEWLGRDIKVIFETNAQSKLVNVLGGTDIGKKVNASEVKIGEDNKYIEIDGVQYVVVETRSDAVATNANELIVFAYDDNNNLVQLKTNDEFISRLGFYDLEMIFNSYSSEIADRAIIKNYKFGTLNLDEHKNDTVVNSVEATNGDYILYYYNSGKKLLEIREKLSIMDKQLVTKLSHSAAQIGDVTYILGNEKAGVSPESIYNLLAVGEFAQVVVKDGYVLAVADAFVNTNTASNYLITLGTTTPVYTNGQLLNVVSANINGVVQNIFTHSSNVESNTVYRYYKDANDVYYLISAEINGNTISTGFNKFAQTSEIATIVPSATNLTISAGSDAFYTISYGDSQNVATTTGNMDNFKFVTDANTIIIAKNENGFQVKKGSYASTITVNDGARIVAVMKNELGSVETLSFLYISDGELGVIDSTSKYSKILAVLGYELVNGTVYTRYQVYNFATGKVESALSLSSTLEINATYATDKDGIITTASVPTQTGLVTGYTSTTITIDGTTYKLADGVSFNVIGNDFTTTSVTLSEVFMKNVEFLVLGDKINTVIVKNAPVFTATVDGSKIVVESDTDISSVSASDIEIKSLLCSGVQIDFSEATLSLDTNVITVDFGEYQFPQGSYLLTLEVNNALFTCIFTVL